MLDFTILSWKDNKRELLDPTDWYSLSQKTFEIFGHIFAKPKDSVTKEQRTDAIYSIPCNECDNEYIGQTKHQFDAHLK